MRVILILLLLFISASTNARSKNKDPFQRVSVPDSIKYLLLETYEKKGPSDTNAENNVYNLVNRYDFDFKDGLYSFKGQGPHFPRRIFISNNGEVFIFESIGAFSPKGILKEFILAIDKLKLTSEQVINYSIAISEYLDREKGQTYGYKIVN